MGIVIPAAAAVLVAAAVLFAVRSVRAKTDRLLRKRQEFLEREQSALLGEATVVNARTGVIGDSSEDAYADLTLEVVAPDGTTYRASTNWLINAAYVDLLQDGNSLSVKIDAADPKIIYPNEPWAEYLPD